MFHVLFSNKHFTSAQESAQESSTLPHHLIGSLFAAELRPTKVSYQVSACGPAVVPLLIILVPRSEEQPSG